MAPSLNEIILTIKRCVKDCEQNPNLRVEFEGMETSVARVVYINNVFEKQSIPLQLQCCRKDNARSERARIRGNAQFEQKNYTDALFLFNRSIALASRGSMSARMAYTSRAELGKEMGQYRGCLNDVARAMNDKYPINLSRRLLELGRISLERLSNQDPKPTIAFDPSRMIFLGVNAEIPCASSAVGISYSAEVGQQVVAKTNIPPGEVIIVEPAYSVSMKSSIFHTACSNCLGKTFDLIPCPYCSNAMFCNEKCLDEAMIKHHQVECELGESLATFTMNDDILLGFRIVLTAWCKHNFDIKALKRSTEYMEASTIIDAKLAVFTKNSNGKLAFYSDTYAPIYHSTANANSSTSDDALENEIMAVVLSRVVRMFTSFGRKFDDQDTMFFASLILHQLTRKSCMMAITELGTKGQVFPLGVGAFAVHNALGHACWPNAFCRSWKLNGQRVMVTFTLNSIKKGERICRGYEKSNRANLRCTCEICIGGYKEVGDGEFIETLFTLRTDNDVSRFKSHDKFHAEKKLTEYVAKIKALPNNTIFSVELFALQQSVKQCLWILATEEQFIIQE